MTRGEQSDVLELMAQIGRGEITVGQAAPRLQELLVPATVRVSPAGDAMALAEAAYDDSVPPYTPNSWDDVYRAFVAYDLVDDEQYAALADLVEIPPAHELRWVPGGPDEYGWWAPSR